MMEQRGEIIKRLNVNRKQSLLLEQEVDGRVIRFRIRKPSTSDFEETIPQFASSPMGPQPASNVPQNGDQFPMVEMGDSQQQQHPNSSGANGEEAPQLGAANSRPQNLLNNLRPDEANVRRMHTALTLNEAILKRSKSAKLVIINLPAAPKASTPEAENNCKFRFIAQPSPLSSARPANR